MRCSKNFRSSGIRLWIAFCGVLLAVPLAQPALGQRLLFGVKAGTPLSDSTLTGVAGSFREGTGPMVLNVRRYTIGPSVELAVPFKFRFEADFLYKRLDETRNLFFDPTLGTVDRFRANSWEYPMSLKYVWLDHAWKPFVLLGGSIRRINSFEKSTEQFGGALQPPTITTGHVDQSVTQGGGVIGSGVRFDISVLKISPEVRYTRWTSNDFLPTRNQVEFLLGISF